MVNGMKIRDHKDLQVWQRAMKLVVSVYTALAAFPSSEKFGLSDQIKRSAVSIPSNIAEGSARKTTKEFIQFLHIALGSAAELETQLLIASELGFAKSLNEQLEELTILRKQLNALVSSLKRPSVNGEW